MTLRLPLVFFLLLSSSAASLLVFLRDRHGLPVCDHALAVSYNDSSIAAFLRSDSDGALIIPKVADAARAGAVAADRYRNTLVVTVDTENIADESRTAPNITITAGAAAAGFVAAVAFAVRCCRHRRRRGIARKCVCRFAVIVSGCSLLYEHERSSAL